MKTWHINTTFYLHIMLPVLQVQWYRLCSNPVVARSLLQPLQHQNRSEMGPIQLTQFMATEIVLTNPLFLEYNTPKTVLTSQTLAFCRRQLHSGVALDVSLMLSDDGIRTRRKIWSSFPGAVSGGHLDAGQKWKAHIHYWKIYCSRNFGGLGIFIGHFVAPFWPGKICQNFWLKFPVLFAPPPWFHLGGKNNHREGSLKWCHSLRLQLLSLPLLPAACALALERSRPKVGGLKSLTTLGFRFHKKVQIT